MLIKKFSFKAKDPHAAVAFFVHVSPIWNELNEEERKLVETFLKDPKKGMWQIVEKYSKALKVFTINLSLYEEVESDARVHSDDNFPKGWHGNRAASLLYMVLDYAEKKGWVEKDERGKKRFVWERNLRAEGREYPLRMRHLENLEKMKEALKEIEERGLQEFLEIEIFPERGKIFIDWERHQLFFSIPWSFYFKAKRKGANLDASGVDDALEVLKHVEEYWERSVERARKKGLVYEDEEGNECFIWERRRPLEVKLKNGLPWRDDKEGIENLKRIRELLEKVKRTRTGRYLEIKSVERKNKIEWVFNTLYFPNETIRRVLKINIWNESVELSLGVAFRLLKKMLKSSGEMKDADRKGCRSPGGRALLQVRRSRLGQAHRERKEAGGQIRGRSC